MLRKKRQILVAGYPKSGNTWLTRLTAELLGCPVSGYFGWPEHDEIATEGLQRDSSFQVYKGHHPYYEICNSFDVRSIIYVSRDPRDIAVSGSYYFGFHSKWHPGNIFRKLPYVQANEVAWRKLVRVPTMREMVRQMLNGRGGIGPLSLPWSAHVKQYRENGVLIVRYEDLLVSPKQECIRILDRLDVSLSEERIDRAIEAQSFDAVKASFQRKGDSWRANFLRKGQAGGWRDELPERERRKLETACKNEMRQLGYMADT